MNKLIIFTILFFFNGFLINADEQIKPNFFTQFEPESFKKSYTFIVGGGDEDPKLRLPPKATFDLSIDQACLI